MMRQLLLISLMLFPVITLAGGGSPWCLVSNENEVCSYNTADQCYSSVAQIGGYCRENARLFSVRGAQKWCVVSATGRKCNFGTQQSCIKAVQEMDAGCVENTEQALARKRGAEYFGFDVGSSKEDGGLASELEAAGASSVPAAAQEQVVLQ